MKIPIDAITPNPRQPRRTFTGLEELADSIREHGLLEPVVVRSVGNGYELVLGERRLRACKLAELTEIEAVIVDVAADKAFELALVENVQREDLTPIEEAEAFAELQRGGWTQARIAGLIGKSQQYVADHVGLLELPESIKDLITARAVSPSVGVRLARIEDAETQTRLAGKAAKLDLTVRDVEHEIMSEKYAAMRGDSKRLIADAAAHPERVTVGRQWRETSPAGYVHEFTIEGELNGLPMVHCECIDEEYRRLKEGEPPYGIRQDLEGILREISSIEKLFGRISKKYEPSVGWYWVDNTAGVTRMTPELVEGLAGVVAAIREFQKKHAGAIADFKGKPDQGPRDGWTIWGAEVEGPPTPTLLIGAK